MKRAITCNHLYQTLDCLLSHGADVDIVDDYGYTPLFASTRPAAYESARILSERSSDYSKVAEHGWGILYALAAGTDLRILGIFMEFGMSGLDKNCRDTRWQDHDADL